jgi:hypothetical protein
MQRRGKKTGSAPCTGLDVMLCATPELGKYCADSTIYQKKTVKTSRRSLKVSRRCDEDLSILIAAMQCRVEMVDDIQSDIIIDDSIEIKLVKLSHIAHSMDSGQDFITTIAQSDPYNLLTVVVLIDDMDKQNLTEARHGEYITMLASITVQFCMRGIAFLISNNCSGTISSLIFTLSMCRGRI